MDLNTDKVKSTDKFNLNINESVELNEEEEVEFYKKNGVSRETFKHMGKDMLQGSIDSYKPKNMITGFFTNVFMGVCIILPPVGLVLSLFKLKSSEKETRYIGKIGIGISIGAFVVWSMIL
ncbi:hypothetical protein [Clostridium lacusfryxellense]|uniref:hypothetical protein n=1 Tax=Clostridium lacusfryxellense TaxID=205328 RepID=UPI001C0E88E7|nr:hypothetical protein [Clostridium lacusfryxellense]MBU3112345.1 hypothetical protein [Clostridium lacusfryxellense]